MREVREYLAQEIRRLRRERGWTQEALSEAASLSQKFLSEVERARANPSLGVLTRLAGALGVSLADLFARVPGRGAAPSPRRPWSPQDWALFERFEQVLGGLDPKDRRRLLQALKLVRSSFEKK